MTDTCRICGNTSNYLFTGTLLGKYQVKYYDCSHCGFVQTEHPYWLDEAYSSPINLTDTGLVRRNIMAARSAVVVISCFFNTGKKFLDYAGGYGLFTRLMRNYGFDFYSHDPYTANLMAKGFEYNEKDPVELVTTFESFEHFAIPRPEIEKILGISKNVFFSTQLIPDPVPAIKDWWYYGTEHGQHVAFYRKKTLQYLADKYGIYVVSLKGYHLFSTKPVNKWLFKLAAGLGRFGANRIVQLFMRSRVLDDMYRLRALQQTEPQN